MKKIKYNSPVVLTFVIVSFAALILNIFTNGLTNRLFFSIYRASWLEPLQYFRLIGHVLGHANWEHFIGNMMIILLAGPLLEEKYGSGKLLVIILVTAIVTALFNVLFFSNGLLGASGVCFAFILLSSITGTKGGVIPLTMIIACIVYLGGEVLNSVFIKDNISNTTHIIGGIVGAISGFVMR